MRNKIVTLIAAMALCLPHPASAQAPNYVGGKIQGITALKIGLLVRLEGNVQPAGCSGPNGWMIVKASSQVIASVVLSHWLSGQRQATIYVDMATPETNPYCEVIQYDPG